MCKQQLANIVCEERQFNLILVYVVKNGYVFANDGNYFVLHGFIDELRVFHENEIIVQNVHDRVPLIIQRVQVRDAFRHECVFAQACRRVFLKHAEANVGAELIGQFQRNWQTNDFEFFYVIDENAHRSVAHAQHKLFGVWMNGNLLAIADFVQNFVQALRVDRVDFNYDLARLQIVNDFLHVDARRNKAHVVLVLVNAVAKHLLALLVDGVYVVQNDQFLFAGNERARLAKYFHVVPIVLNALILQAVQNHHVFWIVDVAVIFANDGVHQGGFARSRIPHNEQIQVVHLNERFQQTDHVGGQLLKLTE
jgi:hypothetical protein